MAAPRANLYRSIFDQHEALTAAREAGKLAYDAAQENREFTLEELKEIQNIREKLGIRLSQAEEALRPREPVALDKQIQDLENNITILSATSSAPAAVGGINLEQRAREERALIDSAIKSVGGNVAGAFSKIPKSLTPSALAYLESKVPASSRAAFNEYGFTADTAAAAVVGVQSGASRAQIAVKQKQLEALKAQREALDPMGYEGGTSGGAYNLAMQAETDKYAEAQKILGLENSAAVAELAAQDKVSPDLVDAKLAALPPEQEALVRAQMDDAYNRMLTNRAYRRVDRKYFDANYLSLQAEQAANATRLAEKEAELAALTDPAYAKLLAQDRIKYGGVTRDDRYFYFMQNGNPKVYAAFVKADAELQKNLGEPLKLDTRARQLAMDYLAEAGDKATYKDAQAFLRKRGVIGDNLIDGLSVIASRDIRKQYGNVPPPVARTRAQKIADVRSNIDNLQKQRVVIGSVASGFYEAGLSLAEIGKQLRSKGIFAASKMSDTWGRLTNTRMPEDTFDSPPVKGTTPRELRKNLVEFGATATNASDRARAVASLEKMGYSLDRALRMIKAKEPIDPRDFSVKPEVESTVAESTPVDVTPVVDENAPVLSEVEAGPLMLKTAAEKRRQAETETDATKVATLLDEASKLEANAKELSSAAATSSMNEPASTPVESTTSIEPEAKDDPNYQFAEETGVPEETVTITRKEPLKTEIASKTPTKATTSRPPAAPPASTPAPVASAVTKEKLQAQRQVKFNQAKIAMRTDVDAGDKLMDEVDKLDAQIASMK